MSADRKLDGGGQGDDSRAWIQDRGPDDEVVVARFFAGVALLPLNFLLL
jgi:hypothetical protein